jgi:branched-chain amino acid transport system substrate-binding protein
MAVSLALAGCGSDDEPTTTPTTSAPVATSSGPAATTSAAAPAGGACAKPTKAATPAAGAAATGPATGAPIKIGALGSYSGAQGDSIGAMDDTLKAWASYTNANGGINGHPVALTVVDDKGDTGTAVTAAEQMVKDGIVAFVGTGSTIDDAWKGVAVKNNIPVIGSADYNPSFLAEPCFFADGAQVPQLVYGALAAAKEQGITKLGIFYCSGDAETPCSNFAGLFKGLSAATVKIPVEISQSIPDNNPTAALCLAAKSKGVDGIVVIENSALVAKFADTCAQQGYKPKQINVSGTNGAAVAKSKNTEGIIFAASSAPRSDTANPEIAKMIAALNQYAPSVVPGDQYNTLDVSAWTGGQLFKKVGEAAGLTPTSTSEDVLAGLYSLKGETLGGLTTALTYNFTGKAAPAFTTSYFLETVKGGKFAPIGDGKAKEIPAADVAAIGKVLSGG